MKRQKFYFATALLGLLLSLSSCSKVYETMDALEYNRQAIDMSTQVISENAQAIERANQSIEENRRQLEQINKTLQKETAS